jgi:hypothetical protein
MMKYQNTLIVISIFTFRYNNNKLIRIYFKNNAILSQFSSKYASDVDCKEITSDVSYKEVINNVVNFIYYSF